MAGCAECELKNGLSVLPFFSWWYPRQLKDGVVKPRNLCLYLHIRGLGNRLGLSSPASSQVVPSSVPAGLQQPQLLGVSQSSGAGPAREGIT